MDVSLSNAHCGACNNACSVEEQCRRGECVPIECDYNICDHSCVSDYHIKHCGGVCGNACAFEERCDGTECVPRGAVSIFPDPIIGGLLVTNRHTVCSGSANYRVACRLLGLSGGQDFPENLSRGSYSEACILEVADQLPPLRNYRCTGTEPSLSECEFTNSANGDCVGTTGANRGHVINMGRCNEPLGAGP